MLERTLTPYKRGLKRVTIITSISFWTFALLEGVARRLVYFLKGLYRWGFFYPWKFHRRELDRDPFSFSFSFGLTPCLGVLFRSTLVTSRASSIVCNLQYVFVLCRQTYLWLQQRQRRAFQVVLDEKRYESQKFSVRSTRPPNASHPSEQYLGCRETAMASAGLTVEVDGITVSSLDVQDRFVRVADLRKRLSFRAASFSTKTLLFKSPLMIFLRPLAILESTTSKFVCNVCPRRQTQRTQCPLRTSWAPSDDLHLRKSHLCVAQGPPKTCSTERTASCHPLPQTNSAPPLQLPWYHQYPFLHWVFFHMLPLQLWRRMYTSSRVHCKAQEYAKIRCSELATVQPHL